MADADDSRCLTKIQSCCGSSVFSLCSLLINVFVLPAGQTKHISLSEQQSSKLWEKKWVCVSAGGLPLKSLFHLFATWIGPPREKRKNGLLGHSHALTVLSNQVCRSLWFPIIITALVRMTSPPI